MPEKIPTLPQDRYKLCNIICRPRNGWTMETFCKANYNAICTQSWRAGYRDNKCVTPYLDFKEKVMMESATVVDSTVSTRGKPDRPEADNETRSFCFKRCHDTIDKEKEWTHTDVWEVCRQHLTA
eukprot:TRINITY_DN71753_c0_g1_i1.p2 TRINITY_DN71753_c0_g1~~TRINITY_DN71753_c0_g1_i1.p2  ORF type:complete len:125 (-),score=17.01 TRINITY_DN71753_c0_g1_i1:21-395(-)